MRLIQIPFSHNCVKVRVALERKGLAYETVDIVPMFRGQVRRLPVRGSFRCSSTETGW